ncbi:MAG: hypothetical protein V3U83_03470, partial [Acidobacteriota bacterium]
MMHALLINGGSKPEINYQSHLHHLEDMVALLESRGVPRERIHVFSADGERDAPDLAVRDTIPEGFWLIKGTGPGQRLKPETELTNTDWQGVEIRPARKRMLRRWFNSVGRKLDPNDFLLLFVTDHGTANRDDLDNGAISLWNEKLTVNELREMLDLLPPGMRTAMVMSQCYSGSFASAMFEDGSDEPSGGVCGFFSTVRDLPAYGCYPEGRDRDRLGHAFRFIDALKRNVSTADAHLEVLVTDGTPDVPLRTSDSYLGRLVAEEAEFRGETVEALVERLLEEAWRDRADWEPEIRLLDRLGEAYGTFSPRSLKEIEAARADVEALNERVKVYARRWQMTLDSVKAENLTSFREERPVWKTRLADKALQVLTPDQRSALLDELLPTLEAHARSQPDIWARLEDLRGRAGRAAQAGWRMKVRDGVLRRMRTVLTGIAGRVLLDTEPAAEAAEDRRRQQRQALEDLEQCEAFEPGVLPQERLAAARPPLNRFPPLADEIELLEELLPSWLGVRFGQVPSALRSGRELPPGATWLRAVFPESPAMAAGLETGDIILGPPGKPFEAFGQLREWTMTSPRKTPLKLAVLRAGAEIAEDERFESTLLLHPYPLEWPKLESPPQVGDEAPRLPSGLESVSRVALPEVDGRPHLLFYWATWCKPCKAAVPEVLAYADAERLPALAITDEDAAHVAAFLENRQEPFFEEVAVDIRRRSFISYGVSGTPTIIVVG